jgi:hypothetical protein
VELKAIAKPPSAAGRQLQDYITEKNKIVMLQNGLSAGFLDGKLTPRDIHAVKHLLYWGLVINFNPATGRVETFVPATIKSPEHTIKTNEPRTYADTELLGCRVKMGGIRGMVDSITAGEHGEILFQIQFSDGNRVPMHRSVLEPILTDIDIPISSKLKRERVVSAFHSSVALFAQTRLKKTNNSSEFVTYKNIERAFEEFSSTPIGGASMWFRNYMQKTFRLAYVKVSGNPRERVLYGGVQKGLVLQT